MNTSFIRNGIDSRTPCLWPNGNCRYVRSRHSCSAKLRGALEPVDRAEEVPLSERYAAMTQDVVRRCYKEEEIRQGELLQIVVAIHFPVVAASGPGDDLALRAVALCARQGLQEAEGGFGTALGGGGPGVAHGRHGGGSNASQAAAGVHGEIRR